MHLVIRVAGVGLPHHDGVAVQGDGALLFENAGSTPTKDMFRKNTFSIRAQVDKNHSQSIHGMEPFQHFRATLERATLGMTHTHTCTLSSRFP